MIEKELFEDIPGGKNNYHSAILSTYSFDFHYFEYKVLRLLKQKWIINIGVLVDQNILEDLLGYTSSYLNHLSQSYSVNGIKVKGVFHPKINYFVGDNKILILFGSGNITMGGHGKNHELFSGFYADTNERKQLPLIQEIWEYIISFAKKLSGYSAERILEIIPKNTELLKDKIISKHNLHSIDRKTQVALIYNEETSIYEQLLKIIPKSDINKITIVSPYYDEGGDTLFNFLEYFNEAKLDVYISQYSELPPNKINNNRLIQFYSWENTNRAKIRFSGKINYQRKLHCKIFHFKSKDYEYCLMGSANATVPGIGSIAKKAINEEFCVLYKTKNRNILNELGISGRKVKIDPYNLIRISINQKENIRANKYPDHKIYINGSDLDENLLKIYIKDISALKNTYIEIYNNRGEVIYKNIINVNNESIIIKLENDIIEENPSYFVIKDNSNVIISNKQIINIVGKLHDTNPSKTIRTLKQIINALESYEFDEFDIMDYYIEYYKKRTNTQSEHEKSKINISIDPNDPEMTYDEAVKLLNSESISKKVFTNNNTIIIWQVLYHLFDDNTNSNIEELINEEETATSESSNPRRELNSKVLKSKKHRDSLISNLTQFTNNYLNSLRKLRFDDTHNICSIDLAHYLLVSHIMQKICFLTKYDLSQKIYEEEWKQMLELKYKTLMKNILIYFTQFVIQHNVKRKKNKIIDEKFPEYLKTTIYQTIINICLIHNQCNKDFEFKELEMIGLNIFYYLGKPDLYFDNYILKITRGNEGLFSYSNLCKKLKDEYLINFKKLNDNKYFIIDHSGICLIKDISIKEIKYQSVFKTDTMKYEEYKKCIKNGFHDEDE